MNIKTSLLSILSLLVIGFFLQSCNAKQTKTTPEVLSGSVLWEVSGNGLKESSYILGSFHVETEEALKNIKGLNGAFDTSKQVVGEMNMAEAMSQMAMMQQAMMMPEGNNYKTLLSEEDYLFLDKKLTETLGAGLNQFGILNPAALSNVYALFLINKAMDKGMMNPNDGMDTYFQTKGKENGKNIVGLETAEDQIKTLFGSKSTTQQLDDLLCSMKNEDYSVNDVLKLLKAYKEGDLTTMYAMVEDDTNNPCPLGQDFENKILHERNNNWMKVLPTLMKEQSNFVVVGALHLAGETGLLQQLVNQGYTVSPIN